MEQEASQAARLAELRDIIAAVRDPEIDETVAELDFILDIALTGGEVTVAMRLPTFWCPANFVWLMAEDMRDRVLALPWVTGFELRLVDHFAEAEIGRGITEGKSFETVFPKLAAGGPGGLRRDFAAKGMLMRQGKLIAALRRSGLGDDAICATTIADMAHLAADPTLNPLWQAVQDRRQEAALPLSADAPAICDTTGAAITDLALHLREIRRTGTNAAANGEMCRMLVAARRETGPTCGAFAPHIPFRRTARPAGPPAGPQDSLPDSLQDSRQEISR